MHGGALVAASAALLGVIVVALFLPATARGADVAGQHREYDEEMEDAAAHGERLAVVDLPD
jgi:hypothetical protein